MYPDSPYAHPIGSYLSPVSPPTVDPDTGDLVQICVNRQWIPFITGSLTQLLLQSTWNTPDPNLLHLTQQRVNQLIFMIGAFYCGEAPQYRLIGGTDIGEPMIRQNPTNPCLLETSVDGTNWCVWADLSKCVNFGTQPGNVDNPPSPKPGGGSQIYCVALQADSTTLIPVAVNDGDQIYLIDANGAGWDGTETNGGLPLWRCVDGEVFFAGACVKNSIVTGTDPVVSGNHMEIIAQAGPDFFPLVTGGTMLVGGQVNQPLSIQVNDSNLADNQGSYTVCVRVVNNKSVGWSHFLDFTLNQYGFAPVNDGTGDKAVWVPGQGFNANPSYLPGDCFVIGTINAGITELQAIYTDSISPSGSSAFVMEDSSTSFVFVNQAPIPGTGTNTAGYIGAHSCVNLLIACDDTLGVASLSIKSLHISGTGTDPFPGAP